MIGCFPFPYPDELLYGICARASDRLRFASKRSVVEELFGSSSATAVVDLPSHLGDLASALPPGYDYTVDRFIDSHTLLPYYAPFLPVERLRRVREDMRGQNGPAIHGRTGIMASRVRQPQWLRFCPACAVEDRERVGECYWRRPHQAPGVEVCPLHGVALQDSGVRAGSGQTRYEFVSAERAIRARHPRTGRPVPHQEMLLRIARDAVRLLDQRGLCPDAGFLRQRYVALLSDRGLVTVGGRTRARRLVQAFIAHYPPGLLALLGCEIADDVDQNWLARLLHPANNNAQHPLHHLLLIQFLGCTAEVFFALQVIEGEPFGRGSWPCLNPASDHYRQPRIGECRVVYSLHTGGRPVGTFECACGFAYARTGPDSSAGDRFRIGKVRSYGPAWETALCRLWDDATISLRGIGRRLGVDPRTVKRHAARLGLSFPRPGNRGGRRYPAPSGNSSKLHDDDVLDAYRGAWLSAVAGNPGAGGKEVRQAEPAAYAWLYRHDREWLREHTPRREKRQSPPRVDWVERDRQLAEAVRAATHRLISAAGRPRRVTVTAVGKAVGQLALLQKRPERLPLTAEALAGTVESREEFAVRRVRWVAESCRRDGVSLTRWRLVRRSGVARLVGDSRVDRAIEVALRSQDSLADVPAGTLEDA